MNHMIKKAFFLTILTVMALHPRKNKNYKSELGQDRFLNKHYFKNMKGGTFVDFGAYDGERCSNSWYFEKKLGWKGICIEPIPEVYESLVSKRDCICVNGVVSNHEGFVTFRKIEGRGVFLSGIEDKYDPQHLKLIKRQKKKKRFTQSFIQVKSYLLNDLLEKHTITHIDYLSVDTEGGELEILKSIDFDTYYVYAISVENNYNDPEMRRFLESKGFKFVKRLSVDEIYINTQPRP